MKRDDVVRVLKEMADLLEIGEGNTFEIQAYRSASRNLAEWNGDLETAVADGSLSEIEGIGKGIAAVVTELVAGGTSAEHQKLLGQFPSGLPELLTLSGIGPKKVKVLRNELGIDGLEALEEAARAERVSELRGFGKKTEERILASMERRRSGRKFAPSTPRRSPKKSLPAATGRLCAGTSGFAYKEWKGSFYPETLSADEFLGYYASRFPTVEINNSFYRFPSAKVLEGWSAKAPKEFLFAVKANRRITHLSRLKKVEEVTAGFVERCQTLGDHLGAILFQLPPTLKRDDSLLRDFVASLPAGGRLRDRVSPRQLVLMTSPGAA